MHKEEERKTKQKRRVVNAAPEQEKPKSLRRNQRGTAVWDRATTQPRGCGDSAGGAGGQGSPGQPRGSRQEQAGAGRGAKGVCMRGERCAVQDASPALPPRLDLLIIMYQSPLLLPAGCICAALMRPALYPGSQLLRAHWPNHSAWNTTGA